MIKHRNGDTIEWNSDSQTFGGIYLKDWIQNMTEDVTGWRYDDTDIAGV